MRDYIKFQIVRIASASFPTVIRYYAAEDDLDTQAKLEIANAAIAPHDLAVTTVMNLWMEMNKEKLVKALNTGAFTPENPTVTLTLNGYGGAYWLTEQGFFPALTSLPALQDVFTNDSPRGSERRKFRLVPIHRRRVR